eukprot:jgi/Psemu1/9871/gm1.9871_g
MTEAHNILTNYQHNNRQRRLATGNGGVAFAQQGSPGGNIGRYKNNITCFQCRQKGRYAWEGKCVKADAQSYREKKQQREKEQSPPPPPPPPPQQQQQQQQQQQPATKTGIAQLNIGSTMDDINHSP